MFEIQVFYRKAHTRVPPYAVLREFDLCSRGGYTTMGFFCLSSLSRKDYKNILAVTKTHTFAREHLSTVLSDLEIQLL
jgi:hypothetical protein